METINDTFNSLKKISAKALDEIANHDISMRIIH